MFTPSVAVRPITVILLLTLTACGYKGDLVLPQNAAIPPACISAQGGLCPHAEQGARA